MSREGSGKFIGGVEGCQRLVCFKRLDSSQHRWIEDIHEPWGLVAMIDNADGCVLRRRKLKREMETFKKSSLEDYKI